MEKRAVTYQVEVIFRSSIHLLTYSEEDAAEEATRVAKEISIAAQRAGLNMSITSVKPRRLVNK